MKNGSQRKLCDDNTKKIQTKMCSDTLNNHLKRTGHIKQGSCIIIHVLSIYISKQTC